MIYNIISTGSQGNAVVINNNILVDCGTSFKALGSVYRGLSIVLLTHIHSDHFNKATIKRLAKERPTLRWCCCKWLLGDLIKCGVNTSNIDALEIGKIYNYGLFKISPVKLYHNVPNCGYRIFTDNKKILYATDTNTLDGISAKGYDLYMLEANHTLEDIEKRIKDKQENGEYAYEIEAKKNHLCKEKTDEFLYEMMGNKSEYVYLHQHRG